MISLSYRPHLHGGLVTTEIAILGDIEVGEVAPHIAASGRALGKQRAWWRCWLPGVRGEVNRVRPATSIETAKIALSAHVAEWVKRAIVFEVVSLQPDDDCPGMWIGFKTAEQRDAAMRLFCVLREAA